MKSVVFLSLAAIAVFGAQSAAGAERYKLRAPGGIGARTSNEVGVWKTIEGAKSAQESLVINNQFTSKDLACIVRPGTKAQVLERAGSVVMVRASNAAFGGCKGYVKTDFLSEN
jgi:hypothetical protein